MGTKAQGKKEQSFVIRVLGKRNRTWQGSIVWVEQKKEQYFRSELEMLKLIDEVLTETCGEDYDFKSRG